MTNLTKFFGDDGYVQNTELLFKTVTNDISDLISQMRDHGLIVDNIVTTGEVVRCRVTETSTSRADKANEKSGYYFFYQMDNSDHFVCVYGSWRDQTKYKFSSKSIEKLSANDKENLMREINKISNNK